MDIRQLQYVLELARYNSFTKAAQALHITQPTLSKMIKSLEEELGLTLFSRVGKSVELTDAGQAILSQAQHIVSSFKNLTSELSDLTNLHKGHIRIGLPPMVGSSFFPQVMSRFRELYPGVTIEMVEEGSKKLQIEIANGHLDMGVVLLPTNEELFDSHLIIRENLKLIVHPSHRLAQRSEVALSELSKETFILFHQDFALHDQIIAECVRSGFHPHVLYESSQWDFIHEMTAANLGIALLPETICKRLDPAHVKAIPLIGPSIPWHLVMIWRKNSYLSLAAREWIRFTQSLF
ncbi:cidABC operon transcriptional activator CidR [Paenibacillus sp. FSL H8-0034]|uniref:cidABC operon transcriptional activator CidR n=1 Tax=Paenibacillus sp. FSL H8-0034 TaxID=2954671 RepID=UPI0030FBD76A